MEAVDDKGFVTPAFYDTSLHEGKLAVRYLNLESEEKSGDAILISTPEEYGYAFLRPVAVIQILQKNCDKNSKVKLFLFTFHVTSLYLIIEYYNTWKDKRRAFSVNDY
ncbi:hypothetical protein GCM10010916_47220 [Paenibacillus abyssi]|uniref:Uncharacterized protein n=1 Tax=Paenibacillus abyssi TaxID=1340531 RepID=A0A917G6K8_9BACL|nr:hypothetical protein GCM10010916_47220 [Paenibacillus abyssi]